MDSHTFDCLCFNQAIEEHVPMAHALSVLAPLCSLCLLTLSSYLQSPDSQTFEAIAYCSGAVYRVTAYSSAKQPQGAFAGPT